MKRNEEWHALREMVADFIASRIQAKDIAGLTWLTQRSVWALSEFVPAETILRQIMAILPPADVTEIPHRDEGS